jgi:murein endopeptidase
MGLVAGAVSIAALGGAVPLAASVSLEGQDARLLETGLAETSALASHDASPPERAVHRGAVEEPDGTHPLDGKTPVELARMVQHAPHELGSASLGVPTRGALWNGTQLRASAQLEPRSEQYAWGTRTTIEAIVAAVATVNRRFAETPLIYVGDISTQRGGALRPHRSHQAGLDADIGFYYAHGPDWYQAATADNLDRARTWALIEALMDAGTVEYIFMDRSVQKLLREHAEQIGEDAMYLHDVFQSEERGDTVMRHTAGHTSHFHVRFADPIATETGGRLYPYLKASGKLWMPPPRRQR